MEIKKVAIIGAGAIGCVYAYSLNKALKDDLAEELKSSDPYLLDCPIDEIKEKIESLYKIICSKNVSEALNMVILFESDEEPNCYAYEEAKYLTTLIKKGSIKLPY